MKRFFSICLALCFVFSTVASADEGMWLYNEAPKDKIKAKYGFELTQQWLDHVRLSSVRFNNGGSGSFVSADGLTFTNHHVGAGCVQQLSTEGHDYIKTGFYAKTQADEAKCPNLELNQLVGIEGCNRQGERRSEARNVGRRCGTGPARRHVTGRKGLLDLDRAALRCGHLLLGSGL
jgi:hypothetical protein